MSFSVGVTQSIKNKQTSEWDSKTTWYKVNSWVESRADYLYQTLKKGDKVVVKGRPEATAWKDNEGQLKAETVIHLDKIVMPPKKEGVTDSPNATPLQQNRALAASTGSMKDSLDDEIPF